jgi:hypothetical protein
VRAAGFFHFLQLELPRGNIETLTLPSNSNPLFGDTRLKCPFIPDGQAAGIGDADSLTCIIQSRLAWLYIRRTGFTFVTADI